MSTGTNTHDVIIIGGGPAGATAAALLAEMGKRVVVLEKTRYPRYCVGESLLPYCYFPLERLGLIERMRDSVFTKKYSVQFVGTSGKVSTPFYFEQHFDHPASMTWQVVRSDFDQMLLEHARDKGAEIRHDTAAKALIMNGGAVVGVRATDAGGKACELHAPMTIDASGRDTFAMKQLDWRIPDPQLKKIAIWTYYKGAKRDPGRDEGATTVAYVPEKGWFWYIPLPNDTVSVGIVAERDYLYRGPRDPDAIFEREIPNNDWIAEHLSTGTKVRPCLVTGDYSYRSKHCATDGLVLTGDAFAFLDPVFSSGVFLALKSGEMAADVINAAIDAGDVSAARFCQYGDDLCRGIEAMRRLVYAFYDDTFSFGDFLRAHPEFRGDLTDCLIGHLFKDFDPMFNAVREFAQVPPPLPHGRPLATAS